MILTISSNEYISKVKRMSSTPQMLVDKSFFLSSFILGIDDNLANYFPHRGWVIVKGKYIPMK